MYGLNLKLPNVFLYTCFLGLSLFYSCNEQTSTLHEPLEKLTTVQIDGYQIPVFDIPDEQLTYTRSWFANPNEKKAALKALSRLHPDARRQIGEATLNLAYMELGPDYRLASVNECRNALKKYQDTIDRFHDLPAVQVKANWYLGWIYCDLLGETKKGIEHYRMIFNHYPDIKIDPASPAPWISIVYSADRQNSQSLLNQAKHNWAYLALIEMIRHAENDTDALNVFKQLWSIDRGSIFTGTALKLLYTRPHLKKHTDTFALEYLNGNHSNNYLVQDIRVKVSGNIYKNRIGEGKMGK